MVNKQMKRCSAALGIHERQMKTTTRYHYTPIKVATIFKLIMLCVDRGCEKLEFSYTTGGNVKWYNRFRKYFVNLLKN